MVVVMDFQTAFYIVGIIFLTLGIGILISVGIMAYVIYRRLSMMYRLFGFFTRRLGAFGIFSEIVMGISAMLTSVLMQRFGKLRGR